MHAVAAKPLGIVYTGPCGNYKVKRNHFNKKKKLVRVRQTYYVHVSPKAIHGKCISSQAILSRSLVQKWNRFTKADVCRQILESTYMA